MPYNGNIVPNHSPRPNRKKARLPELGLVVEVFGLTDMGTGWYRTVVCSERPGQLLVANNGIRIMAASGLKALSRADTIIVPGLLDIDKPPSMSLLDALGRAHRRGARVASICSGAFVLAAAGLLDGRRATAHWAQTGLLASRHPAINVDPNVLYIDDGDVMSSAGSRGGPRSVPAHCQPGLRRGSR